MDNRNFVIGMDFEVIEDSKSFCRRKSARFERGVQEYPTNQNELYLARAR
jgi:hypothetical protein